MDLDDFEELLLDKPEDEKWELIGGRVVRSMVGARHAHHRIVSNISVTLSNAFKARRSNCRTYTETFWLKQAFIKLAAFPDIMVRCGKVDLDAISIDDPVVLFEVVSPASQGRDRSQKWSQYRRLTSLQHYVVVERGSVLVDIWDRVDGDWRGRPPLDRLDQIFTLPAIETELSVADIYADIIEP
jgi:Uma2 family endonuclease